MTDYNGNDGRSYDRRLCDERHTKIGKEFDTVWERMKTVEERVLKAEMKPDESPSDKD